jgi:hypothetical protein
MDKAITLIAQAIVAAMQEANAPILEKLENIENLLGFDSVAVGTAKNPAISRAQDKTGMAGCIADAKAKSGYVITETTGNSTTELGLIDDDGALVYALSSCKEYFIPFNEEIHGQTKDDDKNDIPKVNTNGDFAKKRGVSPKLFIEIEGAWIDEHGLEALTHELIDGVPTLIESTSKPGGNKPAKPGGKPTGAELAKSTPANEGKVKIAKAINALNKDNAVDYDKILSVVLPDGIDDLDELHTDDFQNVLMKCTQWLNAIELCRNVIDSLAELELPEGDEEDLTQIANDWISQYTCSATGEVCVHIGQVDIADLTALHTSLESAFDDWSAYCAG